MTLTIDRPVVAELFADCQPDDIQKDKLSEYWSVKKMRKIMKQQETFFPARGV
jgi:hypothetical protein